MSPTSTRPSRWSMTFGVVIFLASLAAWLFGEMNGIDANVVWMVSGPLLVALFIGTKVDDAKTAAEQAAAQTNGVLDGRIKSSVAAALADRDAARTRQTNGDIGHPPPPGTASTWAPTPASPARAIPEPPA